MLILCVAIVVLAIDQFSKYWITGQLGYTGSWYDLAELQKFLSGSDVALRNEIPQGGKFIVLSFTPNDAALWGLGNGNPWASRLLLAMTAVFVFLIVFFTIRSRKKLPTLSKIIVGLLLGGSIGNLYDRVAFGYVRDMIQTKFMDFPVFNVADILITSGAVLLIVYELFFDRVQNEEKK